MCLFCFSTIFSAKVFPDKLPDQNIHMTPYNGDMSAASIDNDRLLTIDELAERLQYSPDWIRDQVKLGNIPVIRFNARAWRFHWPTVLAAMQRPGQLSRLAS